MSRVRFKILINDIFPPINKKYIIMLLENIIFEKASMPLSKQKKHLETVRIVWSANDKNNE